MLYVIHVFNIQCGSRDTEARVRRPDFSLRASVSASAKGNDILSQFDLLIRDTCIRALNCTMRRAHAAEPIGVTVVDFIEQVK